MLPHADYVADAGSLKIAPDAGRPERQPEMKTRRLHRWRAEQDRFAAVVNRGDIHHRTWPLVGSVVAGELAERSLQQRLMARRHELAFQNDLGVCRHRKSGCWPCEYLDRRTLDGAGEIVLGGAFRQIFEARDEQGWMLAVDHCNRAGLALVPVFLRD